MRFGRVVRLWNARARERLEERARRLVVAVLGAALAIAVTGTFARMHAPALEVEERVEERRVAHETFDVPPEVPSLEHEEPQLAAVSGSVSAPPLELEVREGAPRPR